MNSDSLERIETTYEAGRMALESGQYIQAINYLEKACALVDRSSPLGGEIQMWLVTAYQASGQYGDGIALCKQLKHHPHLETRQQAKQLLYILEAPKLNSRPEWLVEIPDFSKLDPHQSPAFNRHSDSTKSPEKKREWIDLTPVDLTQVKTQDRFFLWFVLGVLTLFIVGLIFWES